MSYSDKLSDDLNPWWIFFLIVAVLATLVVLLG